MKQSYLLFSICFLVFLALPLQHKAQNADNPNNLHNPVWLGFNGGGAWQTSNVGAQPGGGGGITLGKNYLTYTHSKLFWGWRFRYLGGITFGQDYTKNYGIANNAALNGTFDPTVDYVNNGGFVYNNYMMTYSELNLEMLVGPNLIRKRTGSGPLVYLFGGIGLVKTQAFINAKDASGNMYAYAQYDTAARNQSMSVSDYIKSKLDNSYETVADGNANPTWKLMPSLGLGLGYQIRNVFQIGAEYKITFAGNTPIDGILWDANNNALISHNKINYASLFIKFGFGGNNPHSTHTTSSHSDGYKGYNTVVTTPPPSGYPPLVFINSPNINPCAVTDNEGQVNAHIQNVPYAGDIQVTLNGTPVNSWHYNPADGMFSGDFNFIPGNNIIILYVSNSYGTDTKSQYFEYTPVIRNYPAPPPLITITSPGTNPFNSNSNQVDLTAIVNNVDQANEIQVKVNGTGFSNFYFDASTHILHFTAPLGSGNNYVYIQAMNNGGTDSKNLNIYYTPSYSEGLPPAILVTNPVLNPFLTNIPNVSVSAQIQNLGGNGQIQFTVNGQVHTDYTFDPGTGNLQYTFTSAPGNNYIYIRASNDLGIASKNLDVIYTPAAPPAPGITITTPAYSPSTAASPTALVRAIVSNVMTQNQIQVSDNGIPITNFNFYPGSGTLEFVAPLSNGNNVFSITATPPGGTATQSTVINYATPSIPRPVITILTPLGRPYVTGTDRITVRATIDNIANFTQIQASLGTQNESVVYNPLNHIMEFNAMLDPGDNLFSIAANNAGGFDTKTVDVLYSPATLPPPVVTIQYPNTPYNTGFGNVVVKATILNVQNQNQIHVLLNGVSNANFSYSLLSKALVFSASLVYGNNTISILAANDAGSDNKEVEINYSNGGSGGGGGGGGTGNLQPTLLITTPTANPYVSPGNFISITAATTHVSSRNDVHIQVNGVNLTAFSFDPATGLVNFSSYLNPGSNSFYLNVSNSGGSDSKNLLVMYSQAETPKPLITILSPNQNPFTSAVNNFVLEGKIEHITYPSQVQVKLNGQNFPNFGFNPVNGSLEISTVLVPGRNTFSINASNTAGSDEKVQDVDYSAAPSGAKPVISVNVPTTNPYTTTSASFTLSASISNVYRPGDVQVNENGNVLGGAVFNPGTGILQAGALLRPGSNSFTITASNSNGTDTRNIAVNFNTPAPIPAPVITITSPGGNPFRTPDPFTEVTATVQNVSGPMAITVTHNSSTIPFQFDANTKVLTINEHLVLGSNTFVITASNAGGSDMKSTVLINTQRPVSGNGTGTGIGNNGMGTGNGTNPNGFSNGT
ncbi:MAG TPA: hypothetical protein VNZ86_09230, partial [Bacteroidia bacterium]|nr:hypothetical protein [Bacteroidia bacterium]